MDYQYARYKAPRSGGFTLIEILTVLAIIGILAAIAIPSYNRYILHTQLTEGFELAADYGRIQIIVKQIDGPGGELSKGFSMLSNPVGGGVKMQWVPVVTTNTNSNPVKGYILPSMTLNRLGTRDLFALEYLYDGTWRCVSAANAEGRNAVSSNEVLEDKYLPAQCHATAGLMTAHPKAPQGCPPGTQPIQVTDASGKMQKICKSIQPPAQQPLAQQPQAQQPQAQQPPAQQPPVQQPQAQQPPVQQPQAQPPLPLCPAGQDCSHHDSKCPPGQEFIPETTVPVRDGYSPYASYSVYSTKKKTIPAQCVAKCKDGFVFLPDDLGKCGLAPSPKNHVCRGPKFICERSHTPQESNDPGACTADAPYAANHVENLKDGSRYVTRTCITQQEAFDADKYNSQHPECKNYNVVILQDSHFKCTFPCYGDGCNLETVPDKQATWSAGKTSADLPDQFN